MRVASGTPVYAGELRAQPIDEFQKVVEGALDYRHPPEPR